MDYSIAVYATYQGSFLKEMCFIFIYIYKISVLNHTVPLNLNAKTNDVKTSVLKCRRQKATSLTKSTDKNPF